jgi:hypothetical protein
VWQVVYDELKDKGIDFISVALDAGGAAAVRPRIECPDLAERPDAIRELMGWSEAAWGKMKAPEYQCLIDAEHVVADLFHMYNVPQAVWIDEQGNMVRPPEVAGFGDAFRSADTETFVLDEEDRDKLSRNRRRYVDALGDWVENGADSYAVMSPEQVLEHLELPSEDDVTAAAHARLGALCLERSDHAGAERHFRAATALAPGKWNYRRQSMVVSEELIGELNVAPEFWETLQAVGDGYYYKPIALPDME